MALHNLGSGSRWPGAGPAWVPSPSSWLPGSGYRLRRRRVRGQGTEWQLGGRPLRLRAGGVALSHEARPDHPVAQLVRSNNDWLVDATNAFNSSQTDVHVTLVQQPDYRSLFEKYKAGLSTGTFPTWRSSRTRRCSS